MVRLKRQALEDELEVGGRMMVLDREEVVEDSRDVEVMVVERHLGRRVEQEVTSGKRKVEEVDMKVSGYVDCRSFFRRKKLNVAKGTGSSSRSSPGKMKGRTKQGSRKRKEEEQ